MPSVARILRAVPPAVLLLGALSGLTGCPPPYPKCKDDGHCSGHGEVCVEGTCRECRDDTQCKEGYVCEEGACIKKKRAPGTCDVDADCPTGQNCDQHRCVAPVPDAGPAPVEEADAGLTVSYPDAGPTTCELQEIRFEFNAFALTEEARAALERDADCVRKLKRSITVQGHCDERGTEEYNLVLGENRAEAVRRYLVGLGVNESAVKTVSYGKERPKDPGHNEAAWAANRRAELVWR